MRGYWKEEHYPGGFSEWPRVERKEKKETALRSQGQAMGCTQEVGGPLISRRTEGP